MGGRVSWAACVVGLLVAMSGSALAQTTFQPEVTGAESGVHDGRFWVRVLGTGPLPPADGDVYSAFVAALVIDGDGRFFSGYHQIHDGVGETFTQCSDGSEASCPSSDVPLEVVTLDDGSLVFYFDFPSDVDLAALEYGAESGRLQTEDAEFERTIYPETGPVEASTVERDPTALDDGGSDDTATADVVDDTGTDDEEEVPDTSEDVTGTEPAASDDGGIPWGLIGLAAALLGTAAVVVVGRSRTRTRDCTPLQEAYDAARRAYQAAREAQDHWVQQRAARRDEEITLEGAITRGTPAVAGPRPARGDHPDGPDGDSAHTAQLSQWEAEQRAAADAADRIDDVRAGVQEATARLAEADAAVDAARDTLEAARVALAECLDSPVAAPEAETTSSSGTPAPVPASTPRPAPGTRTRTCTEGTRRNWTSTRKGPVRIMVDFEARLTPLGSGRGATEEDAEAMALSLSELAALLGMIDELPDDKAAIEEHLDSLDERLRTIHDEGLGALLQAETKAKLQGDAEAALQDAAGDAVESVTGVRPEDITDTLDSIPKTPWKVPVKVLKFTAELGEVVAHFCGRMIRHNTEYQVEVRTQTMMVDVQRNEGEVCEGGRWVSRRTLDSFVGPPSWGAWTVFRAMRSGESRHTAIGPEQAKRLLERVFRYMEAEAQRDLGRMADMLQE